MCKQHKPFVSKLITPIGDEPEYITGENVCLNHLTIGLLLVYI